MTALLVLSLVAHPWLSMAANAPECCCRQTEAPSALTAPSADPGGCCSSKAEPQTKGNPAPTKPCGDNGNGCECTDQCCTGPHAPVAVPVLSKLVVPNDGGGELLSEPTLRLPSPAILGLIRPPKADTSV